MKIDVTSMFFNSRIEGQTATPAWGTSIGQNRSRDCRIDNHKQEVVDMVVGMTYMSVSDISKLDISKGSSDRDLITCSVFKDVFINNKRIDNTQYTLLLVREHSKSHDGRLIISYAPYIKYGGISNSDCIELMRIALNCTPNGCWFVYDISIVNQSELHFNAVVVNSEEPMVYSGNIKSKNRSEEWKALIPKEYNYEDSSITNYSYQQIFYGAPGTGKSNTIKKEVDEKGKISFRTTFHPDSDYSTFVGAYKPTMKRSEKIYSISELKANLKEIKESGVTYPCHKFAAKFWESLKDLNAETIKQILTANGFTESMTVEIAKGVAIGQEFLNNNDDGKIIYSFVAQSFTKAYVKAWTTTEDVFLIIEEINRGNCAQIFGDLFQLLDRKNGVSEYPVDADSDLEAYISKELANSSLSTIPVEVKEGKKLILPSNLYIWATMNTSDQSLFPIDSAFKRRWDWKYIPIANGDKKWKIKVAGKRYDWWDFLNNINDIVEAATSSEDKKLGYYFVKADEDKNISAETFVSKVVFYLWNDVFKDYGFDWKNKEGKPVFKDEEGKDLTFKKFFYQDGSVIESTVALLLDNLLVSTEEEVEAEDPAAPATNGAHKHLRSVTFTDGTVFDTTNTKSHFQIYFESIKKMNVEWAAPLIENMGYARLGSPLATKVKSPEIESSKDYSYIQEGDYYFVKGGNDDTLIAVLEGLNKQLTDKITINYV